jgi:hypothetical protein
MALKLTKEQKAEIAAGAMLDQIDSALEPHVLTDKKKTKVVGCRTCKRPCVVTYFASAAKTACNDHRDRHAPITAVREIKSDLEPHILTDKDETKEVPCRNCGRPCVVTRFASAAKVACNDCRKRVATPRKTTSIEKKDGRYQEVTKVASPADLLWSEWALHSPMDVKDLRLPDEQAELDTVRDEVTAAQTEAKRAKRERQEKEDELVTASNRKIVGEAVKDKERRAALQAEVKGLEADIAKLDGIEVQQRDLHEIKCSRAAILNRIGFIRGALAIRYTITTSGKERFLSRGEFILRIPDDYLTEADFKTAQKKAKS